MNKKLIMAFSVILTVLISSVYAYTNYYEIANSDVVVRDSNVTIYDSNVTIINSTQSDSTLDSNVTIANSSQLNSTVSINVTFWTAVPANSPLVVDKLTPEWENTTWYVYKVNSERPLDCVWSSQIREDLLSSFYVAWAPAEERVGEDKYDALTFIIGSIGYYDWELTVLINGTLTDVELSSLTKDVETAITLGD